MQFSRACRKSRAYFFPFGILRDLDAGDHRPIGFVQTNLNRPAAERPFDAKYAVTLGGDAVPSLLSALPQLGTDTRCIVVRGLLQRWDKAEVDWRTWNWSRARARSLVRNQADALKASCPAKPQEQQSQRGTSKRHPSQGTGQA